MGGNKSYNNYGIRKDTTNKAILNDNSVSIIKGKEKDHVRHYDHHIPSLMRWKEKSNKGGKQKH